MATLILRPKDYEESTIKIDKCRMTIGRSSRNDICLNDPFASRLHAEVRREGDHVLFVDMGSANGSYLNGQRVSGTVRLQPMDRVRIGETEIEYQTEEQQQSQSTPTVYLSGVALRANMQVQISRSITNKVLNEGASILTSDAAHDPRFQSQNSVVLSQIRSVMAVPLFSGEETFGMVYVDNPLDNRFSEEDLGVLTTIASV